MCLFCIVLDIKYVFGQHILTHKQLSNGSDFSKLYADASVSRFEGNLLDFFLMKYNLNYFMYINVIPTPYETKS